VNVFAILLQIYTHFHFFSRKFFFFFLINHIRVLVRVVLVACSSSNEFHCISTPANTVTGSHTEWSNAALLRHAELHWLDVADRVTFRLCMKVHKCLQSRAPDYLSKLCTPVAQRQHLRSASSCPLVVPRIQLDTYGRHAFAVIGPTIWNALGNDLCDPDLSIASFGRLPKTHLFQH